VSSESYQTRLRRVRRPHWSWPIRDHAADGTPRPFGMPFVVGVLADLGAQSRKEALPQRRFVPIDRDNFNDVMARAEPRLAYTVEYKLTGDGSKLRVELLFKTLSDFDPARVAEQVPVLRKLLQMRRRLKELLSRTEGNDKLVALLQDVLTSTDKRQALQAALKQVVEEPANPESEKKE
jgi:type VI secretion system protein ImpB